MLRTFTVVANYLALVVALWLSLYVITRSPRRLISWLTGLTLLSIAGLYLNILLALNPPPIPMQLSHWLRLILPFWPTGSVEGESNAWLQGWSVSLSVALWHHVTVILRPGDTNPWRKVRIGFGYALAILSIVVQAFTPLFFTSVSGDPLFLNTLKAGLLYPFFAVCLLLLTILCLINLRRSAIAAPSDITRKQLELLTVATLITGLTGPIAIMGSAFGFPVPMVSLTILTGISVVQIGYGVARYSALMDGRTMRRDFIYNGIAVGLVTLLYSLITWVSVAVYDIPASAFIPVILLAITTHTLIDVARRSLDMLVYREDQRQLRASLRRYASRIGEQDFAESISSALQALCLSVRATYGVLIAFSEENHPLTARYQLETEDIMLSPENIAADDVIHLEFGHFKASLNEAALLIPLYVELKQIGAIILGRPINGISYSQSDVDLLLYPSDLLAEAVFNFRQQAEALSQISQLAASKKKQLQSKTIPAKVVEDALRSIYDYAQLGDSPLADLNLIKERLLDDVTHLDRGKAVYQLLAETLEKLKPAQDIPREPPPREWHPYLILHNAYLDDQLNRDIMSYLYISEGTFNRTRRAAIRSLARAIGEMENAIL